MTKHERLENNTIYDQLDQKVGQTEHTTPDIFGPYSAFFVFDQKLDSAS